MCLWFLEEQNYMPSVNAVDVLRLRLEPVLYYKSLLHCAESLTRENIDINFKHSRNK